ncbi:hypothetical protein LX99_02443 [Mucilaginibacter oryzae]|uniref:Uncharacterized protein n=1 Tax=Mucilaginibacter oryzae TaxID=468058 RepID=A0A316HAR2_9SPHI|nr:hypothetical protein [Mucilaginibacter oryzae]PWK77566.1 hypothetical protein LX99_02443 [Mucilaginibacter oryzae]
MKTIFGQYKKELEYVTALVSFLGPIYLIGKIYVLIKIKKVNYVDIIVLSVCFLILIASYIYLSPVQRYKAVGFLIVALFVALIVVLIAKLFRIPL